MIKHLVTKNKHFLLYSLIGVSGVLIDIILFFTLFNIVKIDEQVANLISTSFGILNNFLLNVRFNFKVKNKLFIRFASFYMVGSAGIILTAVIIWFGTEQFSQNPNTMKILSLPVVLVFQFGINKITSFKKDKQK